jgi:hypothetical protein
VAIKYAITTDALREIPWWLQRFNGQCNYLLGGLVLSIVTLIPVYEHAFTTLNGSVQKLGGFVKVLVQVGAGYVPDLDDLVAKVVGKVGLDSIGYCQDVAYAGTEHPRPIAC